MGTGINTSTTNNFYGTTASFTAQASPSWGYDHDWTNSAMSVDEFEQTLNGYVNGLKNAGSKLETAKKDLVSK